MRNWSWPLPLPASICLSRNRWEWGPATLAGGWVDLANPIKLEISGTEGHAAVINGELFFQSKHASGADGKRPWTALPAAWPHAFELFFDKLGGRSVELVSAGEAAYRSAVMEALYQGAATHMWVQPAVAGH